MNKFWYLATPYTKYPGGHEQAFEDAAKWAAFLLDCGMSVFSPIVHSHPLSKYVKKANNTDHRFWLDTDRPFMEAACGMIVVQLPGWEKSDGIAEEIEIFCAAGKPILHLDPREIPTSTVKHLQKKPYRLVMGKGHHRKSPLVTEVERNMAFLETLESLPPSQDTRDLAMGAKLRQLVEEAEGVKT